MKNEDKFGVSDNDDIDQLNEGESDRVYPVFKQSNSMNNMLPSVKSAHEEAAAQESTTDEPSKNRIKIIPHIFLCKNL